MPGPHESHDERLRRIEEGLHREDPRFHRALAEGRPCRPRQYRKWPARLLLAAALAALATGVVREHGLLIAAGLVMAGMAGELLAPALDTARSRPSAFRAPPRR
ncbi:MULTISPECIES: DUF3040 domain-containing protein [unclassified Streptomyces]|uniref:DUF3040 domain-containing protein n=1 Tax=unclassified Streptomyces TaxID=2593676 RepID=UPI00136955A2|nr:MULTISPECIES: DUF3040 domain-containing protein [unclassified Streptomyces]MCW5251998.1 DUF3040 domain-containing protein [Streptomyces sp. SHP 1-2]MYU26140.1 DUF3040 domain-containing protein [Streptomyces sp. SID8352]